jgi:hypothetical protein
MAVIGIASANSQPNAMQEDLLRWKSVDASLGKPVSSRHSSIQVSDLLKDWSKQTGAKLEAIEGSGAGDPRILVALESLPLSKAMHSLWSLLSNQGGAWYWERRVSNNVVVYRLEQPMLARALPSLIKGDVQSSFESEVNHLLSLAALSPEERKKRIADLEKDNAEPKYLNSKYPEPGWTWDGLRIIRDAVKPNNLASLLRGEKKLRVGVADISSQGKFFVRSMWEKMNGVPGSSDHSGRFQEPQGMTISIANPSIAPVLVLELDHIGGYGYAGGAPLDRSWRSRLYDKWKMPGDLSVSPLENRPFEFTPEERVAYLEKASKPLVVSPNPTDQMRADTASPTFGNRVLELAQRSHTNILVRLSMPKRADYDPGPLTSTTLKQYLNDRMYQRNMVQHKWCDDVLLLRHPAWYLYSADDPPITIARKVRRSTIDKKWTLDLACTIAQSMTDKQLEVLGKDCFTAESIAVMRPILAILAKRANWRRLAESEKGVQVELLGLQPDDELSQRILNVASTNRDVRIRISVDTIPKTKAFQEYCELKLNVFNSKARFLQMQAFLYPDPKTLAEKY